MAKLNYFLFCEDVLTDMSGGNKPTFVNVFDSLTVSQIPILAGKFQIAFGFDLEASELKEQPIKILLEVLTPQGNRRERSRLRQSRKRKIQPLPRYSRHL
jgi:hypothetical protein